MSTRPDSIEMMIRLLRISAMYPSPRQTVYYKLRYMVFLFFLVDSIVMMSCGLFTLLSEFKQNVSIGIQGGTIFFGVLNVCFKVAKLSLSDDFAKIMHRSENAFASFLKFPAAARVARAGDQIIANRARLFWKFTSLFFPVSILVALYKVWFMDAKSYLLMAFYTPDALHFSLKILWQLLIVTPAWLILTQYASAFFVITSLIDTYVKCLISLAEEQKEQIDESIYKIHADIILLVKEINKSLGFLVLFEMLLSPLQCCFCAYGTMVAIDNRNFNGIYSVVLLVEAMMLPCIMSFCCQIVIDAGDKLHDSLHSLKWYKRTAKEGRDVAFMALHTTQGLKICYRRRFVINRGKYCDFLQCVFSYITFMKNFKST